MGDSQNDHLTLDLRFSFDEGRQFSDDLLVTLCLGQPLTTLEDSQVSRLHVPHMDLLDKEMVNCSRTTDTIVH